LETRANPKTPVDFEKIGKWLEANPGKTFLANLPGGFTGKVTYVSFINGLQVYLKETTIQGRIGSFELELAGPDSNRFCLAYYFNKNGEYVLTSADAAGSLRLKLLREELTVNPRGYSCPFVSVQRPYTEDGYYPRLESLYVHSGYSHFDYPRAKHPVQELWIVNGLVRSAKLYIPKPNYKDAHWVLFRKDGTAGGQRVIKLGEGTRFDRNGWPWRNN